MSLVLRIITLPMNVLTSEFLRLNFMYEAAMQE